MRLQLFQKLYGTEIAILCGYQFIGINSRDHTFTLIDRSDRPLTYRFDQLISADLDLQYATQSHTTGGRSLTGALLGGMAFGPAGMIVGGLGGRTKTRTEEWLALAQICVTIREGTAVRTHNIVVYSANSPGNVGSLENVLAVANNIVATLREAQNLVAERALNNQRQKFEALDIATKAEQLLQGNGWRTRRAAKDSKDYFDLVLAMNGSVRAVIACLDYANEYDLTHGVGPRLERYSEATDRVILANKFADIGRIATQRRIQLVSLNDLQSLGSQVGNSFAF